MLLFYCFVDILITGYLSRQALIYMLAERTGQGGDRVGHPLRVAHPVVVDMGSHRLPGARMRRSNAV